MIPSSTILLLLLTITVAVILADDVADVTTPSDPVNVTGQELLGAPQGQIIAHDVNGEAIPPAMKAISKASGAEPSLGLHGITEQQLNLRYYNFICSSHFHLDCKITETLQICIKDRYVAVLGLPLSFDSDSSDLLTLGKWMRQCDGNDQDMNQEAMRIIRKRIHFQNENNWSNVFKSANLGYSTLLGVVGMIVVKILVY